MQAPTKRYKTPVPFKRNKGHLSRRINALCSIRMGDVSVTIGAQTPFGAARCLGPIFTKIASIHCHPEHGCFSCSYLIIRISGEKLKSRSKLFLQPSGTHATGSAVFRLRRVRKIHHLPVLSIDKRGGLWGLVGLVGITVSGLDICRGWLSQRVKPPL